MELNKIKDILNKDLSEENIVSVLPELLVNMETDPFMIYTLRSVLLDILSLYKEQEKLGPSASIGEEKIHNLSDFMIKQKVNTYLKKGILKLIDLIIIDVPFDVKYNEASRLIKRLINLEFKEF
ncbi:MAG: hypothetical protein M0016_03770 [Deltaproteobacteria bacterium]|jgi:Txe/YoeB family toxin of Txe-Axe toxin-antitoxin module|nr:hypothetical protein [Deltaproteobacteria bacterium]MCL5880799.1 hypothetical protein [Deltaproteobacteria bacterium]MDA8304265.1 hypothetical protein [Deltaproteobacteria bacterium]